MLRSVGAAATVALTLQYLIPESRGRRFGSKIEMVLLALCMCDRDLLTVGRSWADACHGISPMSDASVTEPSDPKSQMRSVRSKKEIAVLALFSLLRSARKSIHASASTANRKHNN